MKCHSFFQESSSSQCTTSELPDHLLTSILSSSSGTTTSTSPPSSADPRSCPSSVANLSTTLLYSTNDVIVVANKHLHLDTPTLEDGTIHAICSTNSSQDSSLSASTSTLHNQVFYSEDNKPSSSQYQYLSQSQSQSNHGPEKYPQDLPPHTQFSQEALFRSQTDDETQIKSNQETTLLHTTPPAPSPATFCVLFSAQLDPTSSPLTQAQGHQNNSINNDINNNIATISQDNISLLCVQEHQQPQREGSNWFLNNTFNSFSFEPVASCLLSLWSITELSSSGEDWNTCNTKSKNSLSHMSRKRNFADAVEMASPLRNSPSVHHPSWIGSVKRRKIHQFATKWTSGLAPSSFVKIYTMLDFWQVMATRMDCSWLNFDTISEGSTNDMDASETCDMAMESTPPPSPMSERPRSIYMEDDTQNTHTIGETMPCRSGRATLQFPHPGQILRGLWEEEQQNKRRQQMVPDNVRRQARSKTFKTPLDARTRAQLEPWRLTSTNQGRIKPMFCSSSPDGQSGAADVEMAQGECFQLDDELARNKLGSITTAVQRFQAVSEGQALSEYQPWKDGTTIPSQGNLKTLHEIRQTVMDPWPEEISRAKDECTRILHRMREQLNIVINLQIHLRSLIKTAPTQLSFLLSIRHPGQVSIELLLALYGPHFMQTSNFRAIEQLLWGQSTSQPVVQEQVFSQ